MTSGCVDAISFLALGQVFTAAMTGNTVLLGLSLIHELPSSPLSYVAAILGFMIGAAIAATIVRSRRKETGWTPAVTRLLYWELSALAAFLIVVSWIRTSPSLPLSTLLIGLLSFAMGVQGVAARRVAVNGITTTVITSTLTGLMESIVWSAIDWSADSRRSIHVKSDTTRDTSDIRRSNTPWKAMTMWVAAIVFYGMGAAICGALERHAALHAVWLPVCMVIGVIGLATLNHSLRRSTASENQIGA